MKTTERIRRSMKPRSFALAAMFAFALALAQTAGAADCYWAGGTSSDWGTVANWTTGNKVPTNDGAYFRKDKFNSSFTSGSRAYLVELKAAHTNLLWEQLSRANRVRFCPSAFRVAVPFQLIDAFLPKTLRLKQASCVSLLSAIRSLRRACTV